MREIYLPGGRIVLVDDADYELVSAYPWHECRMRSSRANFYAQRSYWDGGRCRTQLMHRLILAAPAGVQVDHRNHDGLDNRRENLRLCSRSENCRNRQKQAPASGFIGVRYRQKDRRFEARIQVGGRSFYVGGSKIAEDAARLRDIAAKKYFGEFAVLNFPDGAI